MKFKLIFAGLCSAVLLSGCADQPADREPAVQTETAAAVSETTSAPAETVTASSASTAETVSTAASVTTKKKAEPPADLVLKCMDTVEASADLTLDEFITERNVELKDGSVMLRTDRLGTVDAEITYLYHGEEFTQTLQYHVTDTTKPYIFNYGMNARHKAGTEFDLNDYVGFGDNFDRHPVLTCEGSVDPDTVGAYPLSATVTDSSGNSVSWKVTIRVAEEVPEAEDRIPRVEYSDFISRYKGDDVQFGIDVSAWQADVDYQAVRDAGCSFVIMRAGYYYSELKPDKYFRQNLKNAAEAGMDIGVYIYTADRTEEGAREHAQWIVEQLDGQKLALPIVFDWEEFSNFQQYGMSIRDLNDVYAAFADEVSRQGYQPMLYGSKNVLETIWSEKSKRIAPVWLAHYTKQTNYEGDYAIWQASAYGRIPGIAGDVDMDIRYLKKNG